MNHYANHETLMRGSKFYDSHLFLLQIANCFKLRTFRLARESNSQKKLILDYSLRLLDF